ncbi:MAG: hypothetical protein NT160_06810, partial [Actinobacteria bacterium]|nr:hypothetical protein [Actinomycetota bacterium]
MKVALRRFLPGLAILGVLGAVVPGVLLSLGGLPTPQGLASALHEGVTGWSWICCWLGWSGAVLASLRDLLRALASDPLARARAGVVGTALAALLLSASPAGASRVDAAAIQQVSARSPLPGARIPSPNARHAPWLVAPGDSLWSIAEASLDDPSAWVAIWNA